MHRFRILLPALCLVVAACASNDAVTKQSPSLDSIISDALAASKSGQHDKALATLRAAAQAHPADKALWINIAQINFDKGKYSEAITAAVEALERDPQDKMANSIVAVSGLHLTTGALTELAQTNNLSGTVRSEAQELARLLRTSLGEDVLVPKADARAIRAVRKAAAPLTGKGGGAGSDPFGALK